MKLTQEEKNKLHFALIDAQDLVKLLQGSITYQEADIEKITPFITNAHGYALNVINYISSMLR